MTTRKFKIITLAGLMSLAACNAAVPEQLPVLPPADSPSRVAAAVPASDALALELFRDVVASEKGNVVFSPASAENLLRLLQRGTTGRTRAAFDSLPMRKPGCFIGILPKGDARSFAATLTPQKYSEIRGALAFSPAADFSSLATDPAGPLRLSAVVQSCYVDVSETETVAAAVTGGFVECDMLPAPPPAIRFDRPFIWAIGDLTTGAAPYFMGLFEQPN